MLGRLSLHTQSFLFRAALVLLLGCLLPTLAFYRGIRSRMAQVFRFTVGILIAGIIPIDRLLTLPPKAKGYLLIVCLLDVAFITMLIPFYIGRTAVVVNTLKWIIVIALVLLFIVNLFCHSAP